MECSIAVGISVVIAAMFWWLGTGLLHGLCLPFRPVRIVAAFLLSCAVAFGLYAVLTNSWTLTLQEQFSVVLANRTLAGLMTAAILLTGVLSLWDSIRRRNRAIYLKSKASTNDSTNDHPNKSPEPPRNGGPRKQN
jgi:hypothetical protein